MAYRAKTRPEAGNVEAFIAAVQPAQKQADARAVLALMAKVSGEPPVMWGPSIVGFGKYHYRYESGHAGDAPRIGFSPRAANLTLYVWGAVQDRPDLLAKVGKHKVGKSCLYLNRLADADPMVLEEIVKTALEHNMKAWPE